MKFSYCWTTALCASLNRLAGSRLCGVTVNGHARIRIGQGFGDRDRDVSDGINRRAAHLINRRTLKAGCGGALTTVPVLSTQRVAPPVRSTLPAALILMEPVPVRTTNRGDRMVVLLVGGGGVGQDGTS